METAWTAALFPLTGNHYFFTAAKPQGLDTPGMNIFKRIAGWFGKTRSTSPEEEAARAEALARQREAKIAAKTPSQFRR